MSMQPTPILDYNSKEIRELVDKLLDIKTCESKIEKIYYFVRDEIKFGYNESDDISASKVLKERYGQCNTKSTLFMALLRAVKIPCRIHFFTIDKRVQKGIITGLHYKLTPDDFYNKYDTNLSGVKKIFFRYHVRKGMGKKVEEIRDECYISI
ncbi:MAG: transglutaminase-like domain-containing protein [Candidatus Methanofastidiosia archaeon]